MNSALADLIDFLAEIVAEEILDELEATPPPEVQAAEVARVI